MSRESPAEAGLFCLAGGAGDLVHFLVHHGRGPGTRPLKLECKFDVSHIIVTHFESAISPGNRPTRPTSPSLLLRKPKTCVFFELTHCVAVKQVMPIDSIGLVGPPDRSASDLIQKMVQP